MLKIYSAQLHEKYQPVPLVSPFSFSLYLSMLRVTPRRRRRRRLLPPSAPPIVPARCFFLFFFLFPVSRAVLSPPRAFHLRTLYIFSFSLLCARTCFASRAQHARELAIHFSALRCHPAALGAPNNFALAIMHLGGRERVGEDIINWRRRKSACRGVSNSAFHIELCRAQNVEDKPQIGVDTATFHLCLLFAIVSRLTSICLDFNSN